MNEPVCRQCGACCIAPSISSLAKPAGKRCPHLTAENLCALFGMPARPAVCGSYNPGPDCGASFAEAMRTLEHYEAETRPGENC